MLLATLAQVLKTTEKNVPARAQRMRLTPTCGRCGGSGHYSFNQISGTTCFGCGGAGHLRLTKSNIKPTLKRAEAAVAAGELDTYLVVQNALKLSKNGSKRVLDAWSASPVGQFYGSNWRHAKEFGPKAKVVQAANTRMYELEGEVTRASYGIMTHKPTPEHDAKVVAFAAQVEAALAEIAALTADTEIPTHWSE